MENNKHHIAFFSKGYYPLLLFLVSFVFVTLFSRSTSFLYYYEGFDAAIFKQMGLAFLRGKTLYVDYFDNKGCILYFIQALGLFLGGNFAILLMQALSLTVTLSLWDKIIAFYREVRGSSVSPWRCFSCCVSTMAATSLKNGACLLPLILYICISGH